MVSKTPNHRYDVYEVGDGPPWTHTPTIRSLDTDVEIRAPAANRLDYQPTAGAKFFATDTGSIHIGTGTAWRRIGTVMDPATVASQDDFDAHVDEYTAHAEDTNAHHRAHEHPGDRDARTDITLDTGVVIADYANQEVPQEVLGGPAASLSTYPLSHGVDTDLPRHAHHLAHEHPGDRTVKSDITLDNQDETVVVDHANEEVPQAVLGGPAASLSAYPLVHGQDTDAPPDAHHTDPTPGTGVVDEGDNQFGLNVVASGTATLAAGSATVDTGVSTSETATFMVALGPATADADVAADVRADSGSGNYEVDIQETDTDIGTPDVNYDVIRVR